MKTFIFSIIFSAFFNLLFSQEEYGFGVGEIYIATYKNSGSPYLSYKMINIGSIWGGGPLANEPFVINPNSPNHYNINATNKNPINYYFDSTHFSVENDWPIFRFITQYDTANCRIGYGLYKFKVEQQESFFYFDYRDQNYSYYTNCLGTCNDIWLKYNYFNDNFYYVNNSLYALDPNSIYWIPIENGSLLHYYRIKGQTRPRTDSFPNYWTNCLVNIEQPIENTMTLSIVFGPHPTMSNVTEYYIYRAVNTSDSTNENNYSFYGRTADSVFLFNDLSVRTDIISEAPRFYYFIKAKNSGGLSSRTNIVVKDGVINWSKALSIINDNDNPRLNWGPNPNEGEILNYKVYRALVTKNSNPPAENSYNLIYTTSNSTTYTYKDEEVAFGSTYDVYYYIKATKSDNSLSDRTNIEKIVGTLVKRGLEENAKEYALSQNYPNPFNPTTSINYELRMTNYATLKVYDLLGNEVATLVNKELPAGSYTAEFSAAGLSSGVYIYTLKAGGYTQSKKMQVIK